MLLVARLTCTATPVSELRAEAPPGLSAALARALARAPADRFPTAGKFSSALAESLVEKTPATRRRWPFAGR
jgi:serine/threonine-protein kinase